MNLEMVHLEIVGLKTDLQAVLHNLRNLGCVQIDELTESPEVSARPLTLDRETLRNQEELSFLLARVEGLLSTLKCRRAKAGVTLPKDCLGEARMAVDELAPRVQVITTQKENLEAELASLPRYEATLRKLLPILPASAREPGNVSVGVLVSRVHVGVLESIGKRALELTGGRADIVAGDVDSFTRAMLVVFPSEFSGEIESLLGREDVSRLRIPAELGEGPPDVLLAIIHRRMVAIPEEIKAVDHELDELADQWCDKLIGMRETLRDEYEANNILSHFGETDMTFVLVGWVPEKSFAKVQTSLYEICETVMVQRLPLTEEMKKRAPIILQNPQLAKPFESLVKLLALPRYGYIDPTLLMAIFLPIFFGMILGDVGYGFLLLVLSLFGLRKFKSGVKHDIARVLVMGSTWAIVFGILYGELFGTLGESLGMHAIWIDRASSEDVAALLVMSLVIGAVHLTLGLVLGLREAIKEKSRHHFLERGGMLLSLIGLFLIVGILTNFLPRGFMSPAVAGLIIGIVMLGIPLGWLGIIIAPIEFIGLIGNILSYLRIAAIGLASVYLAKVANEMAGMFGNIIVGAILALFIHALNLVLGAFSPTIHSLRLHYVEFFRKFYEGGGRPYQPFQSHLKINPKS